MNMRKMKKRREGNKTLKEYEKGKGRIRTSMSNEKGEKGRGNEKEI